MPCTKPAECSDQQREHRPADHRYRTCRRTHLHLTTRALHPALESAATAGGVLTNNGIQFIQKPTHSTGDPD